MLSLPLANSPQGFADLHFNAISHARICALSLAHDDLDSAIAALVKTNPHDDLIIARLKKRKLQIRDEIAGLAAAQKRDASATAAGAAEAPEVDAAGAESMAIAPPNPGGGSLVLGICAGLLILLTVVLGWPDAADAMSQTLTQVYLLSLLAAAHG